MALRTASAADSDLDSIWHYVAQESSSSEVADRLISSMVSRFLLLANYPYLGRARDEDFGFPSRSFTVGEYVILYCIEGKDVLILRVVHGRRDLEALFGK
ncbi:MAG: type II toxin-antitoxin system RelE/ParE family toxin [Silvibacterium sp.]